MGRIRKLLIPGVDKKLLVKDAIKVMPDLTRRRFISGGASLGALTLLTGCDVVESDSADQLLAQVSKFNDAVQAWMFNPDALAPTYPESMITKPFPFNGYYDLDDAPEVDGKDWKLEVRGLVENDAARAAPRHARIVGRCPMPCPQRHFHERQARFARGCVGCAARGFVIGMAVVAPRAEHDVIRLQQLGQKS